MTENMVHSPQNSWNMPDTVRQVVLDTAKHPTLCRTAFLLNPVRQNLK